MANKLDELAELKAKLDVQRMNHEREVEKATEPVRAELMAIEAKWKPEIADTEAAIESLEDSIRADVLAHGATLKGEQYQAVYVKGRTTWDTRGLDGYSAVHPEIERFRKVGEPSVTIRKK